ncbi:alpha/beta fold hydrolase [Solwaraspora sp. WMMD791]|uniref:alpha/beta hydrolase n=1 Tax=Solwaraspora sp. WMMD791 TaxID=3016086 RepID=UPI00249AA345|nr:alpha/beta fold hydrolase [Solwaraspora sp. WMMD791]WFE26637.1 alpha/beta fold hydrolase [Solwaraspora sp. WMMD791]
MSTYLLVHGAWHSGTAWKRVIPPLTEAGHRVLTPSLTGYGDRAHLLSPATGLDTHVEDIVRLIKTENLTDVVLVGHSYAGMVVTSVINEVPERIAQLVYLDAMVPTDGENAIDVIPLTQFLIDQAAQTDAPWRIPPLPEQPDTGLFGVTDPADKAWLRTLLSDATVLSFQQRVQLDNPAADRIPRTHIECTVGAPPHRRPVPPVQPNGTPAQRWELATGHDCMVTAPVELSDLLLKLG